MNKYSVHHIIYNDKIEPWEYDYIDLITLCEDCHKIWYHVYYNLIHDPCLFSFVTRIYDKLENRRIKESMKNKNV